MRLLDLPTTDQVPQPPASPASPASLLDASSPLPVTAPLDPAPPALGVDLPAVRDPAFRPLGTPHRPGQLVELDHGPICDDLLPRPGRRRGAVRRRRRPASPGS